LPGKHSALLLKIDKNGIAQVVETEPGQITEDSVLFLIDEENKKNWLFIGSNVSFIHKRGSMRVANSLKKFGYEINGSIVGRKCSGLEIIDKTEETYDTEKEKIFYSIIQKGDRQIEAEQQVNTLKSESNEFMEKEVIIRPLNEVYSKEENKKEEVKTAIKKKTRTTKGKDGYDKFGVLVTSILQEYPEIMIRKKSDGEFQYIVEAPEGAVCELKIEENKLVISSNSTFGGENKKIKIQQKFINLSKKILELSER